MSKLHVIFVIIMMSISLTSSQNHIRFDVKTGGYSSILVSIESDVKEDPRIIKQIKELFINASASLFKASRSKVYFKDITIEVPSTWKKLDSYDSVPGPSQFHTANIRIANQNPEYKNNPYTVQPSGCYKPGLYTHLTPEFLLDVGGAMTDDYGDLGKQLVHEWAHLRYGVFDEYGYAGSKQYPSFYIDDEGKIRPTSCQEDIKGWLGTLDGGPCLILEGELLPDEDCRFYPDSDKNNATSSLMYSPYIRTIDQFCDNRTKTKHNRIAPNKHNNICSYKSTWQVISSHRDFKTLQIVQRQKLTIRPNFRVIHRGKNQKARFILALDVSRSMTTNDRILTLREAALRFIYHRLQKGNYLGILSFSDTVEQLLSVMKVETAASRKLMADSLPRETYKDTAIGKALLESIALFNRSRLSPEGAIVILITDGEENVRPSISKVLDEVIKAKVIVNTIAIGTKASNRLENLAKLTGGKVFYFAEKTTNPTLLDQAFLSLSSQYSSEDSENIMLLSNSVPIRSRTSQEGTVIIDKDVGLNTLFLFSGKKLSGDLEIKLTDPSGKIYTTDDTNSNQHPVSQAIVFNISDAQAGQWKYTIRSYSQSVEHVDVSVTSEPRSVKEAIRINSWLTDSEVEFPSKTTIYAHVHKNNLPVIHTNVTAYVSTPQGDKYNIPLLDDGAGSDITMNDGIYSAYFTSYSGDGRYSVFVSAENDGQATLIQRQVVSKAPAVPKLPNIENLKKSAPQYSFSISKFGIGKKKDKSSGEPAKSVPAVNFQRSVVVGSFKVSNWSTAVHIAPNKVTNLEASYIPSELDDMKKINLMWTVPGSHLRHPKPNFLEIRASWSHSTLLDDFQEGYLISQSDIVGGQLMHAPFSRNNVSIELPSDKLPNDDGHRVNVYVSLRYKDIYGNVGEQSNIARVPNGIPRVKLPEPNSIESGDLPKMVGIIAGSVVGVLLIVVVMVAVVRKCNKSSTNSLDESY